MLDMQHLCLAGTCVYAESCFERMDLPELPMCLQAKQSRAPGPYRHNTGAVCKRYGLCWLACIQCCYWNLEALQICNKTWQTALRYILLRKLLLSSLASYQIRKLLPTYLQVHTKHRRFFRAFLWQGSTCPPKVPVKGSAHDQPDIGCIWERRFCCFMPQPDISAYQGFDSCSGCKC